MVGRGMGVELVRMGSWRGFDNGSGEREEKMGLRVYVGRKGGFNGRQKGRWISWYFLFGRTGFWVTVPE